MNGAGETVGGMMVANQRIKVRLRLGGRGKEPTLESGDTQRWR